MNGTEALSELALLGVRVSLAGQDLMAGPRHALTDRAREIIRANRGAMILALTGFPDAYNVRSGRGQAEHHHRPHDAAGAAERAQAGDPEVPSRSADDFTAPRPSPLEGPECSGCAHLTMREEPEQGTRRRFFWRCSVDHQILELRRYGASVIVAPPDCTEYEPWKPGTT